MTQPPGPQPPPRGPRVPGPVVPAPPEPGSDRGGPGPVSEAWTARDQLFDQRVVFLWGPLDDAAAGRLAAELMTLDATGDDPVHLHLDSPGGSLEAAFCLIDVIDLLGVEVTATCVGQAAGTAIGPLAVCSHRRATRHARFRLSEPVLAHHGPSTDLASWAAGQQALLGRFCERVATAVGRAPEELAGDLRSGRFLDADQAVAYGLVDEICGPVARVVPLRGRPLGFRPRP